MLKCIYILTYKVYLKNKRIVQFICLWRGGIAMSSEMRYAILQQASKDALPGILAVYR